MPQQGVPLHDMCTITYKLAQSTPCHFEIEYAPDKGIYSDRGQAHTRPLRLVRMHVRVRENIALPHINNDTAGQTSLTLRFCGQGG